VFFYASASKLLSQMAKINPSGVEILLRSKEKHYCEYALMKRDLTKGPALENFDPNALRHKTGSISGPM